MAEKLGEAIIECRLFEEGFIVAFPIPQQGSQIARPSSCSSAKSSSASASCSAHQCSSTYQSSGWRFEGRPEEISPRIGDLRPVV
jgi:hypothetical protein